MEMVDPYGWGMEKKTFMTSRAGPLRWPHDINLVAGAHAADPYFEIIYNLFII